MRVSCRSQPRETRMTETAWRKLSKLRNKFDDLQIADLLANESRLANYSLSTCGLYVDFSKHLVDDEVMAALLELAGASRVLERGRDTYAGEQVNPTEGRAALHMALRQPYAIPAMREDLMAARASIKALADAIRSGERRGPNGDAITDIINIGIGGSDLGPKMVCTALHEFADGPHCHFISNVDGAELQVLQRKLNPATTAILISSKTFTTTETLRNADSALTWQATSLGLEHAARQAIGITASPANALAFGIPEQSLITFPEAIGGRYSLWSAIGLPIAIALGFDRFMELLDGAAAMDQHFLKAKPDRNLPLILGLLGIWYNNVAQVHSHAVVPYCERLGLLVSYLQQLDMESNGKLTGLDGKIVEHATGPVIWGQTGTNGQHAFFQRLHQGTGFVPVDFIATVKDNLSMDSHHRMLLANMIAQSSALMVGRQTDDLHRFHPGNRPSTTILLEELKPSTLGALIALYEHKVFVQAAVWNINPFDQWGVELGKVLASSVLEGSTDHDPSTLSLMKKTGLLD